MGCFFNQLDSQTPFVVMFERIFAQVVFAKQGEQSSSQDLARQVVIVGVQCDGGPAAWAGQEGVGEVDVQFRLEQRLADAFDRVRIFHFDYENICFTEGEVISLEQSAGQA